MEFDTYLVEIDDNYAAEAKTISGLKSQLAGAIAHENDNTFQERTLNVVLYGRTCEGRRHQIKTMQIDVDGRATQQKGKIASVNYSKTVAKFLG